MRTETIMRTLEKVAGSVEPVGSARIAAAVVYQNDIVAIGMNRRKTHPFQSKFAKNPQAIWLHAETDAISKALKELDLKDITRSKLYISRMRFDNADRENLVPGLAKPCSGCQRCAATFGISQICYSTDNGFEWL